MIKKTIFLIALAVLLHPAIALAETSKSPLSDPVKRIAQDPQTKMIVYLESDQCHLVAIGSDGRIVWTKEIFAMRFWHISSFKISNGTLTIEEGNQGEAVFDCKTGSLTVINAL